MISACPDIRCVTIEPGTDEFMVLACDGIWNSKKSQEVVDFVSERIRERGETQLSKICEEVRGRERERERERRERERERGGGEAQQSVEAHLEASGDEQ